MLQWYLLTTKVMIDHKGHDFPLAFQQRHFLRIQKTVKVKLHMEHALEIKLYITSDGLFHAMLGIKYLIKKALSLKQIVQSRPCCSGSIDRYANHYIWPVRSQLPIIVHGEQIIRVSASFIFVTRFETLKLWMTLTFAWPIYLIWVWDTYSTHILCILEDVGMSTWHKSIWTQSWSNS